VSLSLSLGRSTQDRTIMLGGHAGDSLAGFPWQCMPCSDAQIPGHVWVFYSQMSLWVSLVPQHLPVVLHSTLITTLLHVPHIHRGADWMPVGSSRLEKNPDKLVGDRHRECKRHFSLQIWNRPSPKSFFIPFAEDYCAEVNWVVTQRDTDSSYITPLKEAQNNINEKKSTWWK
jgi:hypothetical protein